MYKIILVDDEVLIREAISENMDWEALGCTLVGCFQNGREAIAYVRSHEVDIVVTDIAMPYMDGLELSKLLAEESKDIGVIILSGYDNFQYAKQAISYKVEEYLLKPITPDELETSIRTLTEKIGKKRLEEDYISHIRTVYNKNKLISVQKAFLRVFKGDRISEEEIRELDEYGWKRQQQYHEVILLEIEEQNKYKDTDLMGFAVANVADEILKGLEVGCAIQLDESHVAVILTTNALQQHSHRRDPILHELASKIRQYLHLQVTIGIGQPVPNAQDIRTSYAAAADALEYQYTLGSGAVICFGDWDKPGEQSKLDGFARSIEMAAKQQDTAQIDEMFQEIAEEIGSTGFKKERVLLEFKSALLKLHVLLAAFDLQQSPLYKNDEALLEAILKKRSFEEALELLKDRVYDVYWEINTQKQGTNTKRMTLAQEYMKKHYMESDLSLQSVCDYLGMSPSRFSAAFKESTGVTFMTRLIEIRMEHARRLLENTDFKNYEIADKVGFSDPHYFSVSFKKAVGATPSEYAKVMKEQAGRSYE
ncbi:MAG: response regulator [Lachnospiraceae bacterium]